MISLLLAGRGAAQDQVRLMDRVGAPDQFVERMWPDVVPRPGTHARWQDLLQEWYQSRAWFGARIEQIRQSGDSVVVEVATGPVVPIERVTISLEGAADAALEDLMADWTGRPASDEVLRALVATVLDRMTGSGFLGARVFVASLAGAEIGLVVQLVVESGPPVRLGGIRLEGDGRTRSSALLRASELRPGQSLEGVERTLVRDRLAATGWFDQVGEPVFELMDDSLATLVIPVRPTSPGRFDLSVGSLPGATGGRTRWVGSGHLSLNNAFGAGRTVEMRINRLPDQASSALLAFETPAPRGWPLVLDGQFEGYQQDSTFNRTRVQGGAQLRLDAFTRIGGSFAWDRTRAGQAGGQVLGGSVRIPESSARFAGLTFHYRRVESGRQPRTGVQIATRLERGLRTIRTRRVVELDTLAIRRSEPRERLSMEMAWMGANRGSFGLAMGAKAQMVRVRSVDESELIPFGGATTLRGYDEDRFRGTAVGRVTVEARWYLDAESRAFVFHDAGWVALDADNRADLPASLRDAAEYHPGYGIGFVFSTAAGPVSLSWATNPDDRLRDGRIHVSLSFGL